MNRRLVLVAAGLGVVAAACAAGSGRFDVADPAGFFTGVWHGWIAPVALIWQIFDADIRVYEPNNTGWWYDFGFYIAVIAGFGGLSLTRRRRKRSNRRASDEAG